MKASRSIILAAKRTLLCAPPFVLMRHNDPRFGETTYRLTNVTRGEPDRTLFEPPAGYKIVSGMGSRDFPPRRMPPPGVPPPGRP